MRKLLVSNRGEIALRVIRAAEELEIPTVAVYSDADSEAQHVRAASESVRIGPAPSAQSYLNIDAILSAAAETQADAVHPGYGFLSENGEFARRCEADGIRFVGPSAKSIDLMGDKAMARQTAMAAGVPVVPGTAGGIESLDEAKKVAAEIGYPLLIKAAAGGGGRGIRTVANSDQLADQLMQAKAEAKAAFGEETVYLEKHIESARHVEVQIFGDGTNTVHLYERECSLQRRRQKLIEEAPAPNLSESTRAGLFKAAVALADAVSYEGAGTVEFLVEPASQEFYFIEMNTRIQVEHPVTELICGIDLVREQIRHAQGLPMSFTQADVKPRGASIEMRVNAEDPENAFMPSPGEITGFELPLGPGVRVSTGVSVGSTISPFYDSLIGKIIVWDSDRQTALSRARRAMQELKVEGVKTTAGLIKALITTDEVIEGIYDTNFVENWLDKGGMSK